MSAMTSKIEIDPIDERAYTSLHDNFVCSKYTAQEIEALLDRLAKKKYVVDTNCPNCGAPITKSQCNYCGTIFTDLAEQEAKMELLRKEQAQLKTQASNASNLATLVREYQNHESNLRSILYADNQPCYAIGYGGGNGGTASWPCGLVQILYE